MAANEVIAIFGNFVICGVAVVLKRGVAAMGKLRFLPVFISTLTTHSRLVRGPVSQVNIVAAGVANEGGNRLVFHGAFPLGVIRGIKGINIPVKEKRDKNPL